MLETIDDTTISEEPRRRRRQKQTLPLHNDVEPKPLRKKKRRRRAQQQEEPFWKLVLQVGFCLLILVVVVVGLFRYICPREITEEDNNDDDGIMLQEHDETSIKQQKLPVWELSERSNHYDAYALFERFKKADSDSWFWMSKEKEIKNDKFWKLAQGLREQFKALYGEETAVRVLLERGLSTFGGNGSNTTPPADLVATACRFRNHQDHPFKIAFGGYSVTVGRGNYFHQSYPFVMQEILEPIFHSLQMELHVRNAAIGGVPSFPYGWCFENFWQLASERIDVVSWDYSMNEAGGISEGIEAYLRQIYATTNREEKRRMPLLIVKDTHLAKGRQKLLQNYAEKYGIATDTIVMHSDPAVLPFLSLSKPPPGFQNWRKFGAPPGAPGQEAHHPAMAEHTLLGWMLVMHFLAALELYVLSELEESSLPPLTCPLEETSSDFPTQPLSTNDTTSSILFDTKHRIHCRTSYEPIVSGRLTEIVKSGMITSNEENSPLFMPKMGLHEYNQGWVLDYSESERLAKRKLDRYDNGLGFVDSKQALYGIYNSGPLEFQIPSVSVKSIVVCQVNERERPLESCRLDSKKIMPMEFWIQGKNTTGKILTQPGTLYLGHSLCVQFSNIPTSKNMIMNLTIRVKDIHIRRKEWACSISHVIWEE